MGIGVWVVEASDYFPHFKKNDIFLDALCIWLAPSFRPIIPSYRMNHSISCGVPFSCSTVSTLL